MKILIADDHALFRDTLSHYIQRAQPGYKLQMASSLQDVVAVLNDKKFIPDLCIIDFKMPGMKGYESFANLMKSYPAQSFAVMSGVAETQEIEKIVSIGISGFLPKTLSGRVIIKAIETMLMGERFIPYEKEQSLVPCFFASKETSVSHKVNLTPREKDVLKLLCEGCSNSDIADRLHLKTVTVKLHIRGIFRKLECDNRTRAVLRAKEWGIFH